MKIQIGTTVLMRSLLGGGVDGIGSYTRELVSGLLREKEIELTPFSFRYRPKERFDAFSNLRILKPYVPFTAISAVTGLPFPKIAYDKGGRPDLIHAPDHLIPNTGNTPLIASLMDAIPLSHPEMVTASLRGLKNWLWKKTAAWADHIITISNYSKEQIVNCFSLPSDRVSVTPLGVDERWFHSPPQEQLLKVTTRFDLPDFYFLFVGTLQPRKNLDRLVAAYLALPEAIKKQLPLLIVGRAGWKCEHITSALSAGQYGSSVRWLKHLSDEDLQSVVRKATAFVLPSLIEGFGLPVLEAFASQVPVITSKVSAIPEVAGNAALLVDPANIDEITHAMQQVVEDTDLADTLREKGLERAKEFSWERTVKMTVDIYRKVSGCH